jgi:hypothetical protein
MASKLKEQLDAVRQETINWPAWRRMEIEAEVLKTPLRDKAGSASTSSESTTKKAAADRSS